jgi:hypothetical protein
MNAREKSIAASASQVPNRRAHLPGSALHPRASSADCAMRFLLLLLAFAATAHASVIVYKGTARAVLPSTVSQLSSQPHVYLVVDLVAKKAYYLFYFTKGGQKGSLNFFPLDNTRYVSQPVTALRTIGTFSFALDTSAGADVGVNMFYLRGNERLLQLSNTGAGTTGSFPRVLTGIFREAQHIGSISSIFELNFTLAFDTTQTQLGNNAFKDGAAVADDLSTLLSQKGF